MDTFKIYLSGGMMSFGAENFNKSNEWRKQAQNEFREYNHWGDNSMQIICFNPNDYMSFSGEPIEDSQQTIMDNELWYLRRSDLVLVNFNDVHSLGTMSELAIAYDRRIPIIGVKEDTKKDLHPWQENFCKRIFLDVQSACEYIYNTYMGYSIYD